MAVDISHSGWNHVCHLWSCLLRQQPTVITARSGHCDSEWPCSFARCDDIVRSQSRESRWHCSKCFLWLCNLKRVRRSLDDESMKTLVHAFVTSHVHYGNIILVGAPKSITEGVFQWAFFGGSLAMHESPADRRYFSQWNTCRRFPGGSMVDRTPLHNYSRRPSFYRHFYQTYTE